MAAQLLHATCSAGREPSSAQSVPGSSSRLCQRLQRARPRLSVVVPPPHRRWHAAPAARPTCAAVVAASSAATEPSSIPTARPGDEYFAHDQRPIILFDGVCNLCNGGVNFMLSWDRAGAYRFAALQSPAGRALLQRSGRSPDDISSIVLVEPGASFVKSAAILRIASRLRAPLPLVAATLDAFPSGFKDAVYDMVATNRYSFFGRTQSCRLSDARAADRFISN